MLLPYRWRLIDFDKPPIAIRQKDKLDVLEDFIKHCS